MADTENHSSWPSSGTFLPAVVFGAFLGGGAALLVDRDEPETPLLYSAAWQLEEKLRLCASVLRLDSALHSSQREVCAKIILEALDGVEN